MKSFKNGSLLAAVATSFKSKFYVNVKTESDAITWLQKFQERSLTTYRVLKGCKPLGCIVQFKTVRHCQHFRKYLPANKSIKHPKSSRQKKTECPSRMTIRVYCSKPSTLKQLPGPEYLCQVELLHDHNHRVECTHALSFRDISAVSKQAYAKLFEDGHSPATAMHEYRRNIQLKTCDTFLLQKYLADRATNPQYRDVYQFYTQWKLLTHGPENGNDMFDRLEKEINEYNSKHSSEGGKAVLQRPSLKRPDDGWDKPPGTSSAPNTIQTMALAICTPIMARVHKIHSAII